MVQKTVLQNGIRVVTEQLPHTESVSIGLVIGRGSRHENAQEQGITHFIEHMLLKSGDADSSLELAKKVDAIGGPLNAFTGREYSFIHLHTITDKFPAATALLASLIHSVNFSRAAVEHERQIILHEINHLCEDGSEFIHDLFSRTFWGTSTLGNPVTGSLESVAGLEPQRLEQFYRHEFLNECLIVSVAGNVSHATVVAAFVPILEHIERCTQVHDSTSVSMHKTVALHPRPDSQTQICFGFPALNQTDPRRYAAILLDTIWGGGMSSRIFQRIREKHGWAYSLYSYLNSYSDSGAMVTAVETDISHAFEVVEALCDEADTLVAGGITQDDLNAARQLVQVRFKMGLDNTHVRMERLAMNEFYRNEYIEVKELLHVLDGVSTQDVWGLAADLMRDKYLVACVLGDVDTANGALHNIGLKH
ncbi:MAG: M16 family metallopeptidase [Thermodesulfobacteriota bacterium]